MFVRNKLGYEFLSVTAACHREDTPGRKCLAVVKVHQPAELFFSAFCSNVSIPSLKFLGFFIFILFLSY